MDPFRTHEYDGKLKTCLHLQCLQEGASSRDRPSGIPGRVGALDERSMESGVDAAQIHPSPHAESTFVAELGCRSSKFGANSPGIRLALHTSFNIYARASRLHVRLAGGYQVPRRRCIIDEEFASAKVIIRGSVGAWGYLPVDAISCEALMELERDYAEVGVSCLGPSHRAQLVHKPSSYDKPLLPLSGIMAMAVGYIEDMAKSARPCILVCHMRTRRE